MTGKEIVGAMRELSRVFDIVRIVDTEAMRVIDIDENGKMKEGNETCHHIWGRTERCDNCVSSEACKQNKKLEKIEIVGDVKYRVMCSPIAIDGKVYSLETVSEMDNDTFMQKNGIIKEGSTQGSLQDQLYIDPLTGVLNRRYFEENFQAIHKARAIAVIDIDDFKSINDGFGHVVGDVALKAVTEKIRAFIRGNDILVRFGGDEFLLAFEGISKEVFLNKMETIRGEINKIKIPNIPDLKLSVSIGCSYGENGKGVSFEDGDRQLYVAKMRKNSVAIDNEFVGGNDGQHIIEIYGLQNDTGEKDISLDRFRGLSIIKKQNAIITGLSGAIEYACYINFKEEEAFCFQMSGRFQKVLDNIKGDVPFFERMRLFFSEIVHPDDKERFREAIQKDRVIAELTNETIYIHDFRVNMDGETVYYRIQFLSDKNDPDGIMFGLINVDGNKREEKRRNEEETLHRMMEMVGGLDDEAAVIYIISAETGRYMAFLKKDNYSDIEYFGTSSVGDYFEDRFDEIEKFIYGPDHEKMRQYINLSRLVGEIDEKGVSQVEYRMMQDGVPTWCEARAVYTNNDDLKTIMLRVRVTDKLRRAELGTTSLDSFVEKYTSVFKIDLDNNSIFPYRMGPRMKELRKRLNYNSLRFRQGVEKFIRHNVVMEDCAKAIKWIAPEYIREKLKDNNNFIRTIRMVSPEGYRYYEVSINRVGNGEHIGECVLGIVDKHEEIMRDYATRLLMEDFYSAYIISLKTGRYKSIYKDSAYGADWGVKGNYDIKMQEEKPFIHPNDWHVLDAISTTEKLKQFIREKNITTDELIYRTNRAGFPWETCIIKVLDEFEGLPSHVLVAYGAAQSSRPQELEYQKKHKRIDKVLALCTTIINSGLEVEDSIKQLLARGAGYYHAPCAYVCDLDQEAKKITINAKWNNSKYNGDEKIMQIEELIFSEEVTDTLMSKGEIIIPSRDEDNTGIILVPFFKKSTISGFVAVVNPARESEDLSLLRYISAFVQGEQRRKKREEMENEEMLSVISALSDDFAGISYITIKRNKNDDVSKDYRADDEIFECMPQWAEEKNYAEKIQMLGDVVVHPDDKDRFREEASREVVMKNLRLRTSHKVNFRAIIKDEIKHYQLKFVGIKDANGKLKGLVAGLRNTEEEVNAERLRQEELEQTVKERTREIVEKNQALNRINEEIVDLFGAMTEARDLDSGQHIKRVKDFTYILAMQVMKDWPQYSLTDEKVALITSASALHDVGKIMISDTILLKPGKLSKEEYDEMKTHCIKGCKILEKAPSDWSDEYIKASMEICRWHHEKYDGKGYPDGLKGDAIPISAQIVSIADCFDALTSKRPYKDAFSSEEAVRMIYDGECGQFSPKILESFKKCLDQFSQCAKGGVRVNKENCNNNTI